MIFYIFVLPRVLTTVVTALMEDGTDMKLALKNTKSAKRYLMSSEGALIAILLLSSWGICASILLLVAMHQ